MDNKIVRESVIIGLLFVVIMFTFGVLFYDSTSVNTEEISSIKYTTNQNVKDALAEIQQNSGVDIKQESSDSLLKSYSIGESDLNFFASDNSYESGKKNPFEEYSEPVEEIVSTTSKSGIVNNSQTSNKILQEENEQKVTNKTDSKVETNNIKQSTTQTNITKTNLDQTTKQNTVSKDKKENTSVTEGTFFESKNSK